MYCYDIWPGGRSGLVGLIMPSLQSGMNVGQDRFWNMVLKQVRDGVYKIAKSAY